MANDDRLAEFRAKVKKPSVYIPIAYLGGFLCCLLTEAILIAVAAADIYTTWITIGFSIAFGIFSLIYGIHVWLKFSVNEEISLCVIQFAIILGVCVGIGGGYASSNNLREVWYYDSLSPIGPLSSNYSGVISSSKVSITFNQNTYLDLTLAGNAFFWAKNFEGKWGVTPEKVFCVAPISTWTNESVEYTRREIDQFGNYIGETFLDQFGNYVDQDGNLVSTSSPTSSPTDSPIINYNQTDNSNQNGSQMIPPNQHSSNIDNQIKNQISYNYWAIGEEGCCRGMNENIDYSGCNGWARSSSHSTRHSTLYGIDVFDWDDNIKKAVDIVAELKHVKVGDKPRYLQWEPNFSDLKATKSGQAFLILFLLPAIWPLLICALACALAGGSS